MARSTSSTEDKKTSPRRRVCLIVCLIVCLFDCLSFVFFPASWPQSPEKKDKTGRTITKTEV